MFEFLRQIRKSEEEKRQEMLSAYLDDALTPAERERFERLLSTDETLRASLEEQRLVKASLARLPRMRAPRNFTLDPAIYGRPARSTAESLYPIMRVATAVVAILFVLVLVIDLSPIGGGSQASDVEQITMSESQAEPLQAPAAAAAPTEQPSAETAMVEGEPIEVTRVVTEAVEMAVEAPAEEVAAIEATVEEEIVEGEAELPSPEDVAGGGGPAGDEAEAEEAPLAMEAVPDNENLAAELEAGEAEDRTADALPPQLATAGAAIAEKETAEVTLTQEAMASRPTASPMASLVPPPGADGEAATRLSAAETIAGESEGGLSTGQVLAVILGLFLVALLVLTLLLRRQTR